MSRGVSVLVRCGAEVVGVFVAEAVTMTGMWLVGARDDAARVFTTGAEVSLSFGGPLGTWVRGVVAESGEADADLVLLAVAFTGDSDGERDAINKLLLGTRTSPGDRDALYRGAV